MNKYEKDKYKKDFPEHGYFNWKTVKLKTPDNIYYDGHKQIGVLLHDGNFMINGVLFLASQFEIIDEDPLKLETEKIINNVKLEVKSNGVVVGHTYNEGKTIEFLDNEEALKIKDNIFKSQPIGISSRRTEIISEKGKVIQELHADLEIILNGELIECPNCKHHFDSGETFQWLNDEFGFPTIEYLSCPRCNVATEPIFSCSICPSKNKCTLDEECGATLHYSYDDWKVV